MSQFIAGDKVALTSLPRLTVKSVGLFGNYVCCSYVDPQTNKRAEVKIPAILLEKVDERANVDGKRAKRLIDFSEFLPA